MSRETSKLGNLTHESVWQLPSSNAFCSSCPARLWPPNQGFGVDPIRIHEIAAELADVQSLGIQIAIVVGGGNFFRGVAEQAKDMDRVSADHMGMLATVINALALQDALEKQGVHHPRACRPSK